MTDVVIRASGLRKVFRTPGRPRVVALDGLDLSVPAGGVHGFLGPNGSGKTTTIRLLLGLARPTSGTIELFGRPVPDHLDEVIGRIGAVVERPAFTPGFSGRKNLLLLARVAGVSRKRVDEVLIQVGLAEQARRRFGSYSLGMRQRLGLAAALLRSPDLLLLDEPTNGLDPAGIREIRELVRDLGQQGVTVLISSHNLAEVQQVCDSVSILGEGTLLASGTVADLLGESVARTRIQVADPTRAGDILTAAGYDVTRSGEDLLIAGHEHPEQLSRALAEHDIHVRELTAVRPDLESYFLQLTGTPIPPQGEAPEDDQ